jgi:hypothetical protein
LFSGDETDENNLIDMLNDVLEDRVKIKLNSKYEKALKNIALVRFLIFLDTFYLKKTPNHFHEPFHKQYSL